MAVVPPKTLRIGSLRGALARLALRCLGWRIEGEGNAPLKCVVTAAPHTSNWDLLYTLLAASAERIPIWFMMKDSHFWWPMTLVWRRLGGVPINRRVAGGVVSQMARVFHESNQLCLVIPPEGTRRAVSHWKTGFYWIAHEAGAPIWPWFINYQTKRLGNGALIQTTGDIDADFQRLRSFYESKMGAMPHCRPPERLQEGHSDAGDFPKSEAPPPPAV